MTALSEPQVEQWHGCYETGWGNLITPESFAHPAKYSRDLIERIFDHCLERGYIAKGGSIGDPFGGIGTGGITAAYRGLEWIGCELEPRFVAMAENNFALHAHQWRVLGSPSPRIIQGDSRAFHVLLGGDYDAVVSSPPYAVISTGAGGLNTKPAKHAGQQSGRKASSASQDTDQRYGITAGQIGRLKSGSVDGMIFSPPFATSTHVNNTMGGQTPSKGIHSEIAMVRAKRDYIEPESTGQIGNTKGESYWQAMDAVYRSCYQAIRPGGVIVLVLKDYVSKRKRVPLCDDTAKLLEHIGYAPLERIQAMLVKETRHGDLFHGETVHKKERKSFFRRLHEKKPGAVKIDFEEVLFYRSP